MTEISRPKISMIAALGARTRAIGKAGKLLWRISGDLPRFKSLTTGHPIIMGQKTFESIGKVLPNRTNIIISHMQNYKIAGAIVTSSPEEALDIARGLEKEEVFIIGGGQIYSQMLKYANRLYLTLVDENRENGPRETADTFFPDYSDFNKIINRENFADANPPHKFVILER